MRVQHGHYRVSYYFIGNTDGREDGYDSFKRNDSAHVNASFNVGKRGVLGRVIERATIHGPDGRAIGSWYWDGRANWSDAD